MGLQEDGRQRQVLGVQGVDDWKGAEEECQGGLDMIFGLLLERFWNDAAI